MALLGAAQVAFTMPGTAELPNARLETARIIGREGRPTPTCVRLVAPLTGTGIEAGTKRHLAFERMQAMLGPSVGQLKGELEQGRWASRTG